MLRTIARQRRKSILALIGFDQFKSHIQTAQRRIFYMRDYTEYYLCILQCAFNKRAQTHTHRIIMEKRRNYIFAEVYTHTKATNSKS